VILTFAFTQIIWTLLSAILSYKNNLVKLHLVNANQWQCNVDNHMIGSDFDFAPRLLLYNFSNKTWKFKAASDTRESRFWNSVPQI